MKQKFVMGGYELPFQAERECIIGGKSYVKDKRGTLIKWFRSFKKAKEFADNWNKRD